MFLNNSREIKCFILMKIITQIKDIISKKKKKKR